MISAAALDERKTLGLGGESRSAFVFLAFV